jgi:phage-related minor tail protein
VKPLADDPTTVTVSPFVKQDLSDIRSSLDGITVSANNVSTSLTRAFANAIVSGKSFNDTLALVATSLSKMALTSALQPISQGLTSLASSAVSGLLGSGGTMVAPFAEGGIVASPTFFGSGGGLGLMGERGAEAIVPLSRGPDGRLGLAADAGNARPVAVNVTIQTQDAESFRRSEAQVSGALARAVARGQRGL